MPRPRLCFIVAGMVALAALSGCESSRTLRVASENHSGFSYDPDGSVVLRSEKTHNVAVRVARERGTADTVAMPALTIYVTNGGKKPMMVGPENISAVTGDSQPVPVLGRVDTAARLQREDGQAFTQLNNTSPNKAASDTIKDASMSVESSTTKDPTAPANPDPFPGGSTSGGKSRALPDSATSARYDKLLGPLLVRTSVSPGQTAGGTVKLDPAHVERGALVRLSVAVDGERHDFIFTVQ